MTRLIGKMDGKKKSGEKVGGQKKRPLFQKPKKWGISKKIKNGHKMGGYKNPPIFKNGDAKNKKNRKTPCGCEKIQIFAFFKKKKRWGENGRKVKIPHFLKMGVKLKKKWWGRPPFF